jgi:biopolymer transport protein ExbB
VLLWILLLGVILAAPGLFAQQAKEAKNEPPAAESASGKNDAPETLLDMILAGGLLNIVFMTVLGIFSIAAVTVIIERLVNLKYAKVAPPSFVQGLQELVERKEDNPAAYRELCKRFDAPISGILRAGLLRAGRPVTEVEKAMEDAAARESSYLRGKIRPLTVLANVAPLVGLLGTVVGMVIAFRETSQAETGKGEMLAQGIYLALLTTVAGLTIAIPAQLFAAWFSSKTERYLYAIDQQLMETIPCFVQMEQGKTESPSYEAAMTN